jgi:starch synthase (maltosyl-transferring)
MLCVSRASADHREVVLMVLNLDPHKPQTGAATLDLSALGVKPAHAFEVRDLLTGSTHRWQGGALRLTLDPSETPARVFSIRG